ncbi:hypothetical protein ACFVYP_16095 [Kitasatospora sp. NPDC058201]|uniref:hypothetical protein n=1 Tax=unclassified Kitasatospora TaxID=2633591 RepID=UPI00364B6FCB
MADEQTPGDRQALRRLRMERMRRLMDAARNGESVATEDADGVSHVTQPPAVDESQQLAEVRRRQKQSPGDGRTD